jgi:uncharacterized protein YcbK (DUF882 family)
MENIYGNGFYWWIGVVEDRKDPMFLGRCRVRIVGYHTADKAELPTADLPWAYPLQPITSAAMSGIGTTPVGPVEGTWVTGYFRDGEDGQEPIIIGTMAGVPGKSYYDRLRGTNKGFQDPDKVYPKSDYLDTSEPDTNRLARNQSIGKTIVKTKDDGREKGVSVALDGTWDQPLTAYNASYPYNHVFESESGHTIEIDDTTDNERITMYHKAGTFIDVDRNGTMVHKVVGDNYEIYARHNNILIKGNSNVTIEGNCKIYVKNNCDLQVDGNLTTHVHGDYELNVAGKIDIASGKAMTVYTNEDLSVNAKTEIDIKSADVAIESSGEMKVKAGSTMKLGGTTKTSISSPITEGNIFQGTFKGALSVSPPTPVPTFDAATVRDLTPVDEKTPTLPEFSELIVPNREEVLTFTLDLLGENFEENAAVIKKLQEQAIDEGLITREELNRPQPPATATDNTPAPSRRQVIPGCGDINNQETISNSLKISNFFTIGNFTNAAASRAQLRAFNGNTIQDMACNLKALAEQCIDPIKQQYPNVIISSGFRDFVPEGGALNSQHLYGQAADLQFPGFSKDKYYEVAQWIKANVNFDQLLLEYKTTGSRMPWIHVTFNRNGCRNTFGTFMNHRYASGGRGALLNLGNV